MSNNAAIRRRAGTATPNPLTQSQKSFQNTIASSDPRNMSPPPSNQGLTLQQVITLIDTRLTTLEKSSKSTTETIQRMESSQSTDQSQSNSPDISTAIEEKMAEYFSEFDTRTELLAKEISNLKQIVLNLQAYTLEINKTLMEERIRILSDIPRKDTIPKILSQNTMNSGVNRVIDRDVDETVDNVPTETMVLTDDDDNAGELTNEVPINSESIYDEEGLLADTTLEQDVANLETQDGQLLNKKRQRQSNNKKGVKLSI
jgi:hypothetical protein